jgi:hypothetical protein
LLCAGSKGGMKSRIAVGAKGRFATNGRRPACAKGGELDGAAQRLAEGLDAVGPHHDECKDGKLETGLSRMRGFLRLIRVFGPDSAFLESR